MIRAVFRVAFMCFGCCEVISSHKTGCPGSPLYQDQPAQSGDPNSVPILETSILDPKYGHAIMLKLHTPPPWGPKSKCPKLVREHVNKLYLMV